MTMARSIYSSSGHTQARTQTHYSARVEALAPLNDWTREMGAFWAARLDRFEDLLNRMDQ